MVESKGEPQTAPTSGFKFPQTHKETLEMCKDYKTQGNQLFKEKDYKKANTKYSRVALFAKSVLDSEGGGDQMMEMVKKAKGEQENKEPLTEAETQELRDVVAASALNMSICFFQLKNYQKSKEKATQSIDMKKSIKGFYRRAQAKAFLKDFEGACLDLKEAIKLDTTDPNDCQAELIKYEKYAAAARKQSESKLKKAMQKGLFGGEEEKPQEAQEANQEESKESVKEETKQEIEKPGEEGKE